MEAYRTYLRAFIAHRTCGAVSTEGAGLTCLAAIALAVHDATHGREPRSIQDITSGIFNMLKEDQPCA